MYTETMNDTPNYILNVDWLTLYGSQHIALAQDKFVPLRYKELLDSAASPAALGRDAETAAEEHSRFSGVKQIMMGNLILDVQEYGTRIYSTMWHVYYGRELFGVLLAYPRMRNVRRDSFLFKIYNYWLYQPDVWERLAYVCGTLGLAVESISRIDLAADFNAFAGGLHPIEFIRQFMSGELKKKGRSRGRVFFAQEYRGNSKSGAPKDCLQFNALQIGKRSSDACCYLYNKSLELKEETMKPWIVDCWRDAGLDVDNVWRLEVSLTSKALTFFDKTSGEYIDFGLANLTDPHAGVNALTLFHAYLQSLFFFFYPTGQANVSREKMLPLFGDVIPFSRSVLRHQNPSDRAERVLIKKLHTLADKYRGFSRDDMFDLRDYAAQLADSTQLTDWYERKRQSWIDTKYKS